MYYLFVLLFAAHTIFAQVTVKSETANTNSYQKFVSNHKNRSSYIQDWEAKQTQTSLKSLLMRSQFHFLEGSLEKAKEHFQIISDKRFDKSWSESSRKSIIYALFRLAQLAQSNHQRDEYLLKALEFDERISPETNLFPPPMVQRWAQLKIAHPSKNFLLPKKASGFDKIYINGRPISNNSGIVKTLPGFKRIDFVSNTYQPVTLKIAMKDLETLPIKRQPFAQGDCNDPKIMTENTELKVFVGKNCVLNNFSQPKAMETSSTPLWSATHGGNSATNEKPSFWRRNRTALIIGSVVATGLVAWHLSQKPDPQAPTRTQVEYIPQSRTQVNSGR